MNITDLHESICYISTTGPTINTWKSPGPTHLSDEKLKPKEIKAKGHTVTNKQRLELKSPHFQVVVYQLCNS